MPVEDYFPNRGDESKWVKLNEEETRCLKRLAKYYTTFEERSEDDALVKAWKDLQGEFPRLQKHKWCTWEQEVWEVV